MLGTHIEDEDVPFLMFDLESSTYACHDMKFYRPIRIVSRRCFDYKIHPV